eukprot:5265163-Lingulodinium_polyedra.AAC.1
MFFWRTTCSSSGRVRQQSRVFVAAVRGRSCSGILVAARLFHPSVASLVRYVGTVFVQLGAAPDTSC